MDTRKLNIICFFWLDSKNFVNYYSFYLKWQHGRRLENMFIQPPGIRIQTTWCSFLMSMDTGEDKQWKTKDYRTCTGLRVEKLDWVWTCLHSLPQSIKDSGRSELSRITFVFETVCSADCKFLFLAVSEMNKWTENVLIWIKCMRWVSFSVGL